VTTLPGILVGLVALVLAWLYIWVPEVLREMREDDERRERWMREHQAGEDGDDEKSP